MKFSEAKVGIVVGAGHGIGLGLTRRLAATNSKAALFATYRDVSRADALFSLAQRHPNIQLFQLDPCQESELAALAEHLGHQVSQLDFIINCVGLLHDQQIKPEKNLRQLVSDHLMRYFLVNSTVTPLIAKAFFPFLRNSSPAVFAAISAKVGSIEDNRLGGWYGYRASKAALNMFLQTIAHELYHHRCNTAVFALHPGTTETELSKPYVGTTKYQLHSIDETAINLISAMEKMFQPGVAQFVSWDGTRIPW